MAEVLSQISHLNPSIVDTAIQYLASVIDGNPKLQYINSSYLYLDSKQTIVMLNGMKNLTNLIHLDVSNNDITNDAAKILALVLSRNISLHKLHLEYCSLQTEGAVDIFNAVRDHPCLTYLNIKGNKHIAYAAYVLIAVLCNNSKLNCDLPDAMEYLIQSHSNTSTDVNGTDNTS